MSANLRAQLVNRRRGRPLTERIDGLEDDVDDLQRKRSEDRAHLEGHIEAVRGDIENQQAAQQSEQARRLGRSLRYQELGVVVFIAGVALTTVGSV